MTKPAHKYNSASSMPGHVGGSAVLDCPGHPCHRFTNSTLVKTSEVIAYDGATGKVETKNSIYEVSDELAVI